MANFVTRWLDNRRQRRLEKIRSMTDFRGIEAIRRMAAANPYRDNSDLLLVLAHLDKQIRESIPPSHASALDVIDYIVENNIFQQDYHKKMMETLRVILRGNVEYLEYFGAKYKAFSREAIAMLKEIGGEDAAEAVVIISAYFSRSVQLQILDILIDMKAAAQLKKLALDLFPQEEGEDLVAFFDRKNQEATALREAFARIDQSGLLKKLKLVAAFDAAAVIAVETQRSQRKLEQLLASLTAA